NAGVLRRARREQKSRVVRKGKSSFDSDFQYEYEPRKRGLSILWNFLRSGLEARGVRKRRRFLILRCRLFLSLRSRIRQALDCSPTNRERELGLDRRETACRESAVATVIRPSTRGTVDSDNWRVRPAERPWAGRYHPRDYG
ncbi:hypothetical protein G9A89_001801, partial [Geosiphon pyriformis]